MRSRGHQSKAGFTLIEVLAALLLTSIIALSSVIFFSAISREVVRPVITYSGQNYALAPILRGQDDGVAKTDLFDAIDLHREFSRQVYNADFVAVFGGANVNAGAPTALQPLATSFNSTSLASIASSSPSLLLSTNQVANLANADLSALYDGAAGANAFTVLAFQQVNQIVAIAQVRRYTTTYEGQSVVLYETTLRSRTLPSATWTTYAYRFWLPANEDTWAQPIGARHYWYRYEAGWWGRNEPTGSTLVFPDPFVLAVNASDARVKPVSRFSYFVSTSP